MTTDATTPLDTLRIDARSAAEREVIAFLRTEHLPGIDTDDEAGVALEIEQARLILVGAAGAIAFGISQLLTLERAICVEPVYASFAFLLAAVLASWIALLRGGAFREWRVERRMRMFRAERARYVIAFRTHAAPRLGRMELLWRTAMAVETAKRRRLACIRYLAIALAACGFVLALWSVVGTTQPRRCPYPLQPPAAKATAK